MRTLLNFTELCLYASLSCGAAFLVRLYPATFWPIAFVRAGVFFYCLFIVARAEQQREIAIVVGVALFLGMLAGYSDYIELVLRFDASATIARLTAFICFGLLSGIIFYQLKSTKG